MEPILLIAFGSIVTPTAAYRYGRLPSSNRYVIARRRYEHGAIHTAFTLIVGNPAFRQAWSWDVLDSVAFTETPPEGIDVTPILDTPPPPGMPVAGDQVTNIPALLEGIKELLGQQSAGGMPIPLPVMVNKGDSFHVTVDNPSEGGATSALQQDGIALLQQLLAHDFPGLTLDQLRKLVLHVVVDNQPEAEAFAGLTSDQLEAATVKVLVQNLPDTQKIAGTVGINNLPAIQEVRVTNPPATQPVSGSLSITNLPASQKIEGSVAISNLPAVQEVSIKNLPASQKVEGSVAISNLPATQPVSGSVSISNLPTTQAVSGTVAISNLPATQPVSGSVTVSNLPAVQPVFVNNFPATQTATLGAEALTVYSLVAALGNNPALVRAGATKLYAVQVSNHASSARYLMLYNTAAAPSTGTGPVCTIGIPPGQSVNLPLPAGRFVNFSAGLGLAMGSTSTLGSLLGGVLGTTGVAANDVVVTLYYSV